MEKTFNPSNMKIPKILFIFTWCVNFNCNYLHNGHDDNIDKILCYILY